MKKFYLLLLLSISAIGFSQAPANYYNNATGTGYTLKTQLKTIISSGHVTKSYAALYTCYQTSDRDYFYENDGTILDIYSENPAGTDPYIYSATITGDRCGSYSVEGDCFNREHLMPQSVFSERTPMVSDAHHILPTDGKVNGMRSNYPFGKVNSPTWTSRNGSKLGNNSTPGYSGRAFEPIDEFKGDVARAILYFGTRYQDQIASWNHAMLDGTSNHVFSNWFLDLLLTWHNQDPVSPREITRNNAIYAFQGNRNPYIDHPEFVTSIWGMPLSTETFDALASISVYPNPSNDHKINIETEQVLNEIQLINVNGQLMQNIKNPNSQNNTYTLENLPSGFYFLKLTSENHSTTKKVIIN